MADKKLMVVLGADTSGFNKAMDSVRSTTQGATENVKKGFGGVTGAIGKTASSIGKIAGASLIFKAVDAGIGMITKSFDTAISRVDTLQRFPKVLQLMGFSAEDASKATSKLSEGIQGLPTKLQDVVGTTQRLVSVFGEVGKATDTTLALNNAFLASGASSADASRGMEQYIQMLSAGKVDMQSWRSLQETMPYALQKTAEAFGFTGKSAQKDFYGALQNGDVTMDQFNDKLIELSTAQGGFAEVALESSKGINTSWENIQTAIANGVAGVISSFDEWLNSNGFGGIAGVLDNIKEAVKGAFGTINEWIPKILDGFVNLYEKISESTAWETLSNLISKVVEWFQGLWDKLQESGVLEEVKNLMEELGQAILDINFEKFVEDIGTFLDKWSPLIAGVAGSIATWTALQIAIALVNGGMTIMIGLAGALGTAFAFITSPIGIVIIAIGALIAIGVYLYKNWDEISAWLIETWENIKIKADEIWTGIKDYLSETWDNIKTSISNKVEEIKNKISESWENVKETTANKFNEVKAKIEEIWTGIKDKISEVVSNIKQSIEDKWNNIKEATSNKFNEIRNTASQVWENIKEAMTRPVTKAKEVISRIIDDIKGFFNRIQLKLPEIQMPKLPHFSLTGSFSLMPPSVPHLSVDWYETGGIATSASVVGIGENGTEAILPLSNKKRMKPFASAVASMMADANAGNGNNNVSEKTQTLIQGNNFIIREEADIKKIARELFELEKRESRARGRGM